MTHTAFTHEANLLRKILTSAGALLREKYAIRSTLDVTSKSSPNDLLTEADLAVQAHIIEHIRNTFSDDYIVGEEGDFTACPQDPETRCWIIDPIDGTQNFVRGLFPAFGISLAFASGGHAQAGGVLFPISNDLFHAQRGQGAFRNNTRIEVSRIASVGRARIEIDFSGPRHRDATLACTSRLIRNCGQLRCHCATVVGLCSVAAGEMDGFTHVSINPWDYAAGQLLVEEAGGTVTRLDGSSLPLLKGRQSVLASNGHIHQELLSLLDEPNP